MLHDRFARMHRLVESPPFDLPLEKWSELYDLTVGFDPDLVLELGRGWGNSTCVFTEAAGSLGCRVVSIGFDAEQGWKTRTAPRLAQVVDDDWFTPLTVLQDDIRKIDFAPLLAGSLRTLVYWDAHGKSVAEAVLGRLVPALPTANRVVVDDIWATPTLYGLRAKYQAGPLWSQFEEVVPLWSFLQERGIEPEHGERWISFTARDA